MARAPSNIALIKYMGKKDSQMNVPANPSLSMTLNSLCTVTEVEMLLGGGSVWLPETPRLRPHDLMENSQGELLWLTPQLSDSGQGKLIRHLERVRQEIPKIYSQFGMCLNVQATQSAQIRVRTANTFPLSSGIASSASSFASVTLALAAALAADRGEFERAYQAEPLLRRSLARLSRQGSGSSCRSFEGPWVYWEGEESVALSDVDLPEMAHFVILMSSEPKEVSSSEAHLRIQTSPLWQGRVQRVELRIRAMIEAMQWGGKKVGGAEGSPLARISRLAWAELWEMHSLFHTAEVPFTYWQPATVQGLQFFAQWMGQDSSPIVTLDAGPNLHLIVPKVEQEIWRKRLQKEFHTFKILEDQQGLGAKLEKLEDSGGLHGMG
jgi:diphosphomevalonate decarboxylase